MQWSKKYKDDVKILLNKPNIRCIRINIRNCSGLTLPIRGILRLKWKKHSNNKNNSRIFAIHNRTTTRLKVKTFVILPHFIFFRLCLVLLWSIVRIIIFRIDRITLNMSITTMWFHFVLRAQRRKSLKFYYKRTHLVMYHRRIYTQTLWTGK